MPAFHCVAYARTATVWRNRYEEQWLWIDKCVHIFDPRLRLNVTLKILWKIAIQIVRNENCCCFFLVEKYKGHQKKSVRLSSARWPFRYACRTRTRLSIRKMIAWEIDHTLLWIINQCSESKASWYAIEKFKCRIKNSYLDTAFLLWPSFHPLLFFFRQIDFRLYHYNG